MKYVFIILFFITSVSISSSQSKRKKDTVYYQKYTNRFIISVFQSYKNYAIEISQKLTRDTTGGSIINYIAESNYITGIELNYDKLNIVFGITSRAPQNQALKGNTQYRNMMLNIGGNKWIIETSYRRYKGFYNNNTGAYDTTIRQTGIFTQLPNLKSEAFKTKFIFFTNSNKFSFKSGYSCGYRQLKTAASFILSANIYYKRLQGDSSIIPYQVRNYYSDHQSINGLNVLAFSIYGGGSVNIVLWKALFFNGTLIIGPEEQWRTYSYNNVRPTQTLFYTSISGDLRISLGLNFKKFFTLVSYANDYSWYNSGQLEFKAKYYSFNFALGIRLYTNTPKFYQKFQQSKLYKKL